MKMLKDHSREQPTRPWNRLNSGHGFEREQTEVDGRVSNRRERGNDNYIIISKIDKNIALFCLKFLLLGLP